MRYMTLLELLDEVRVEARLSLNAAHGVQNTEPLKHRLRRIQEELYLAYDWPHLVTSQTKVVPAGGRYAEYPDKFSFEGIQSVHVRDDSSGRWLPVDLGITIADLNLHDSDADDRSFPPSKWQNYLSLAGEAVNTNMFEIWPIPDREATFRFAGRRALFPLVEDTDRTTLDGPLIALHAAVEILASQKAEDASLKLEKARERMRLIKMRQRAEKSGSINLAGQPARARLRPGLDYIP